MPKARAPLDLDRYQELKRLGLPQRQIAKELGIPESTLRDNLRMIQKAQASQGLPQVDQGPLQEGPHLGDVGPPPAPSHWASQGDLGIPVGPPTEKLELPEGFPQGDLGIPLGPPCVDQGLPQGPPQEDQGRRLPDVPLGPPQPDQAETAALTGRALPNSPSGGPEDTKGGPEDGTPEVYPGPPPLYVHPGIPDGSEDNIVGGEDIEGIHQGIPALPALELPQSDPVPPPGDALSPQLAEALTTAWPELQQMLMWWRERQRSTQEPNEKLERVTYHVAPKWIEAVKREADLTGESYAAIVNRAFAQYFAGKSP